MYTNIDGGNGNDLSVDDLKLEKCATVSSTRAVSVCANLDSLNLFSSLTNNPVTNGTWTGPSLLSNGYWGTYSVGANTPGTYFYASTPYSAAVGCPSRIDTVVAIPSNNPVINLPQDTILCTNQFLSLNAGAGGITNYLWSTGATTSNIIASTTLSADTTIYYSVIITNQAGCTGTDTVQISFVVCSGINEVEEKVSASIFPNPASNFIQLQWNTAFKFNFHFRLMDVQGKIVFDELITSPQQAFSIQQLPAGVYHYQLVQHQDVKASGKLMIQK
jgi:Secretion system C-terminal sorting domain